ncbi:hypothetical protein PF66_06446, partial [Pseudomonas asplenii]
QNKDLYTQLKNDSANATGILDKNLAERRETSSQLWAETMQSVNDGMRSVGDAIRPVTDKVAEGITFVAKKLTDLSDSSPKVVMGIAGITAAVGGLITLYSTAKIGRGMLNVVRGRRGRGAATGDDELPQTGNKVVDAGLDALGKVLGGTAANDVGAALGEPQRVFVVNAREIGGVGSTDGIGEPAGRRRRGRRRRGGRGVGAAVAGAATIVPAAAEVGRMGRVFGAMRGASKVAARLPGGKIVDAGMSVLDTALNAKTQDEKAEGYGGAAGGLAGALAGGAAGAAIGSIVPVIGTAIGGAIGAALGGMGGEGLGSWLGKKWFGEDEQVADAEKAKAAAPGDIARSIAATAPAPTAPVVAQALEQAKPSQSPRVDQQFSYAPNLQVTVQGDAKDPDQLFRSLESRLRSSWEQWSRESMSRQSAGQLFDEPHV